MGRRKKEEGKIDTNAWITTYTDLMTLLLTFFVLLLSISTIDHRRKREALNSLVGAFGFKPSAHSVIGSESGMNLTVGSAPMTKEEVDLAQLQNLTFRNGLESDVKIQKVGERIVITLSKDILFEQGSTQISSRGKAFLSELAPIVKRAPGVLEMRGYADRSETVFDPDPFRKGIHLSTGRALTVHHFLNGSCGIPVHKMVAHGFGVEAGERETPAWGKSFNRQVELICNYGTKVPYHLRKKPWTREFSLDFKGFLFRLKGDGHE